MAVVDSGAEETVAPPGLLPGQVEESPMQRAGGRYRAANGSRLPNLGQQVAAFRTSEGLSRSLRFQIAGDGAALDLGGAAGADWPPRGVWR